MRGRGGGRAASAGRLSRVTQSYVELCAEGRTLAGGVRIGHPGRGWGYWPLFTICQLLRLRWSIRISGAEHVQRGPAILIGNHLSLLDPVFVGLSRTWRLTFFTKIEAFERRGGWFFWSTGQIPLRRGDELATRWALAMSAWALKFGNILAIYPEGTRSPDRVSLHRLHRRVLIPVLQANPDVPVHVVAIAYPGTQRGRRRVDIRVSPPLTLDISSDDPQQLTDTVTEALLALGGMPYVHEFAREMKART